jgi:hypothetical protein
VSVRRWTGTAVRASRLPASVSSFPLRDGTDLAAVHRQWKSPRHIRSPRCCHAPRPARLSSSPVVFSRGRSSGWICTEFRLRQVVPRSGGFAFRPSTGAIWITHKLFHPSARRARKSWVTALSVGLGSSQSLCPCTAMAWPARRMEMLLDRGAPREACARICRHMPPGGTHPLYSINTACAIKNVVEWGWECWKYVALYFQSNSYLLQRGFLIFRNKN